MDLREIYVAPTAPPNLFSSEEHFSTHQNVMGQRQSMYEQGVSRKSAWTALACGAALMSDGSYLADSTR